MSTMKREQSNLAAGRRHRSERCCKGSPEPSGFPEPSTENDCLVGPEWIIEQQKTPDYRGFCRKRLKGLEPSTFCMANAAGAVDFGCLLEKAYI
jgi:hypothetical protein